MAKLRPQDIEAKLVECRGNMAAAARQLGCVRSTIHYHVGKRVALQKVLHDVRESMKDDAESALYTAVLAGEAWAVCFYLKTQAKDRGYIERSQVDVDIRDLDEAIDRELGRLAELAARKTGENGEANHAAGRV
jgi:hypothetical protein